MKCKNCYLLESFLVMNDSYSYVEEIDHNFEIKEFIVGLLEITDELNSKRKQESRETIKDHLIKVKQYICKNIGTNYKLARDIQIEIDNIDSLSVMHTDY